MIKSLEMKNYKGFSDTTIEFSDITCITGENNTGKSTIIQAIYELILNPNYQDCGHCINPESYKSGITDVNDISLSLDLTGGKIVRTAKDPQVYDKKIVPQLIQYLSPIEPEIKFELINNKYHGKLIKDQLFNCMSWQNILSKCDITLYGADALSQNSSNLNALNECIMKDKVSLPFSKYFNDVFSVILDKYYDFKIYFERGGQTLHAKMSVRYKTDNNRKFNHYVDLKNQSVGFRLLITFCSHLFNSNNNNKRDILFVLDEPFTGIHPRAQMHLIQNLYSLHDKFQMIYTTHSVHSFPGDRNKIVCTLSNSDGDLSVCSYPDYHLSRFYDLPPLDLNTIEEIEKSDSAINVCVEGPTDDIIYRRFFAINGVSDIIDITVVGSSSKFKQYMEAFASINKPSLFILDPNEKVDNLKHMEKLARKHDNLFLLQLPLIEDNLVKKGIENLIPNDIIMKAFKQEKGVQKLVRSTSPEKSIVEYTIINGKKKQLAEFFVNQANENDYHSFGEVINKITEIRKNFEL